MILFPDLKSIFFLFSYLLSNLWQAFSQHTTLSSLFLEHVVSVLNQIPVAKISSEKGESHSSDLSIEEDIQQAAVLALNAFFRLDNGPIFYHCLLGAVILCL